ncbi:glycosyltransferase family 39 protein [Nostoc sp. FACHB-152]|uniref:ArnT family glycosyltransferase n=1 Tax=unclassified Nostoc TaxID=2593658 RepID=UPI00168A0F93|nr:MULTISPECIES: glycosyltransferase family 39 protein [unclassified Nostoc]MBD2452316.1 glycosyltransferase family 39 protein [Nostoc sp. FACHB-152]MBD2469781.1 glycosyltransferase family 39 protein [Nostoc sp. FACHB-145]
MQKFQKWSAQKTNQLVLILLVGGLLFRSFIAFWLYPTFDEAYYYLYSLHLDWSYFDHPVFVALTTGFGPWLTGDVSQFTIRLGSLILYTGSLVLLYLTSNRLFSAKAACLTLAIATISPVFQVGFGILSLPDSPLMFFWSASLYCAVNEFFRQPGNQKHSLLKNKSGSSNLYVPSYRLSYLGILVGLACDSKYHGFILGLGLIGFCLTSPPHRCVVRSPWAWLGLGLFVMTIFPIWFWNMQHDWVSFRFQSERAMPRVGYNLLSVAAVYLGGVAYLFPTIGLPLWWVSLRPAVLRIIQLVFHKSRTFKVNLDATKLLNLWVSLPLILGFTLLGGYRQILPAWPMPGFWAATLLLGQQAVIWEQHERRRVRRWLLGSGIMVASLLLIALLQVTTGIFQKPSQYAFMGGFLPPKDDPSTELIDIQQLRRGFVSSPLLSAALENSSFIFTNRYYLGGPIAMSLKPLANVPITCFDIGNDMRGFAFWSRADQWLGENALYITTAPFKNRKDLMANYRTYFSSLTEIETIPIRRGGVVINIIYVYQAKTLLKPYPRSYGI